MLQDISIKNQEGDYLDKGNENISDYHLRFTGTYHAVQRIFCRIILFVHFKGGNAGRVRHLCCRCTRNEKQ